MVRTATGTPTPTVPMQGVLIPQTSINPELFFELTRGERISLGAQTFPGHGLPINVEMRQAGILGGIWVNFDGQVVVTLGGGTAATTAAWPYNLLRSVRFSANGQSNLINCRGWMLKAREFMHRGDLNDRGVARGITGASPGTSRTQGTLSLSNEDWGLGQNVTAIVGAPTTYDVNLSWYIPIAYDRVDLTGAIFAQTSATDLELILDTALSTDLFTLTGAATAVLTGTFDFEAEIYSIPLGPNGDIVVPDLSVFHSIIETRKTGFAVGPNEVRLAGQGVGRQLMRTWWQLLNGSTPAPLRVSETNFAGLSWLYGGSTEPQRWRNGRNLAYVNEDLFSCDFGQHQGIGVFDWASEHAFRDSIDEGSATELRLNIEVASGVSLTSPAFQYAQETLFTGGVGA